MSYGYTSVSPVKCQNNTMLADKKKSKWFTAQCKTSYITLYTEGTYSAAYRPFNQNKQCQETHTDNTVAWKSAKSKLHNILEHKILVLIKILCKIEIRQTNEDEEPLLHRT